MTHMRHFPTCIQDGSIKRHRFIFHIHRSMGYLSAGTVVRLSNGEMGIVISINPEIPSDHLFSIIPIPILPNRRGLLFTIMEDGCGMITIEEIRTSSGCVRWGISLTPGDFHLKSGQAGHFMLWRKGSVKVTNCFHTKTNGLYILLPTGTHLRCQDIGKSYISEENLAYCNASQSHPRAD